jgi:hypothetical protein
MRCSPTASVTALSVGAGMLVLALGIVVALIVPGTRHNETEMKEQP